MSICIANDSTANRETFCDQRVKWRHPVRFGSPRFECKRNHRKLIFECSIHDDLEQQSLQLHSLGGQWKDKALFDQHIQVSTFHTDGLLPTRPSSKQIVEQTITRMLCHDTFIANSRLAAMKLDDNVDRRYEQSNAIAQRINKNIYEHWIKASNGCGQNIKVQVCYYKTIVMNVPPEIKNAVLGIQPSMKRVSVRREGKMTLGSVLLVRCVRDG